MKKELKLEIGARGEADKRGKEIVGNLSMEQVVKIAKAKGFYDIEAGECVSEVIIPELGTIAGGAALVGAGAAFLLLRRKK